jgi:DNA-binding transcriptional LysR family regulator
MFGPFVWFPRRSSPVFFDHLVAECARGGLSAPHIVQESADESILLSFVACGVGVAIVSGSSQWRHPQGVSLLARDRSEFAAAYRVDLAKGRYFTATHQFHGRRKSAG